MSMSSWKGSGSSFPPALEFSPVVDLDVLSLVGDGDGDCRSARRRIRSRPPGVLRRTSWGDRGGHWEAITAKKNKQRSKLSKLTPKLRKLSLGWKQINGRFVAKRKTIEQNRRKGMALLRRGL